MRLFAHQDVENYFEEVDATNLDDATLKHVATAYEDGQAIVLKGLQIPFDAAFYASIQWPKIDVLKKFKSMQTIAYHQDVLQGKAPAHDPKAARNSAADQYSNLLTHVFQGDQGKLDYFMRSMVELNASFQTLLERIFPTYRFTRHLLTYRLSETINEHLHLDTYPTDLPDHHVRVFLNLDNVQRIWHTSHRLTWLLEHCLDQLPRDFVATATPGRICHDLNQKVFGWKETAGREGAAKHICVFEPGEVWIVDSRKVSHQIFFGRRAVSTESQVDPASMLDPEKHYFRIVERHREKFLRAAA